MADMRVILSFVRVLAAPCTGWGRKTAPPLAAPATVGLDEAGLNAASGSSRHCSGVKRAGGQFLDLSVHEVQAAKDMVLERYDVSRPGERAEGSRESVCPRLAVGSASTAPSEFRGLSGASLAELPHDAMDHPDDLAAALR